MQACFASHELFFTDPGAKDDQYASVVVMVMVRKEEKCQSKDVLKRGAHITLG